MTAVPIKGVISSDDDAEVYEFFGYSVATPTSVQSALDAAQGMPVVAEINSPGGDVFAGSEIYTALKNYAGDVEVDIVGLAASAASIIAMAGDTIKISPTAQMMIHRASTVSQGNSDDLASDLQGLDSTDQGIANLYAEKTGMDVQDIYKMMSDETWINAQDAVKQGFADEVMFAKQPATVTNIANGSLLSKDMISKVKTLMRKAEKPEPVNVKENKTENNSQSADSERKSKLAILFGEDKERKGDK